MIQQASHQHLDTVNIHSKYRCYCHKPNHLKFCDCVKNIPEPKASFQNSYLNPSIILTHVISKNSSISNTVLATKPSNLTLFFVFFNKKHQIVLIIKWKVNLQISLDWSEDNMKVVKYSEINKTIIDFSFP